MIQLLQSMRFSQLSLPPVSPSQSQMQLFVDILSLLHWNLHDCTWSNVLLHTD